MVAEHYYSSTLGCVDFTPVAKLEELLSPVACSWWVAAGWAVDLHLGRTTRQHADIDVMMLQKDLPAVADALPDVYAEHAESGQRIAWDQRRPLIPGPESLALEREFGQGIGKVQILVGLVDGTDWVFHRGNGTIRRPLGLIERRTSAGLPYLAPEVVLLFKSRHMRDKDAVDFESLLPVLTPQERTWLRQSIVGWQADHPWLERL